MLGLCTIHHDSTPFQIAIIKPKNYPKLNLNLVSFDKKLDADACMETHGVRSIFFIKC